MKIRSLIGIALLTLIVVSTASAQTPAMKPSLASGDVASIESGKIVLQTKDGPLDVTLSDKTEYKRVPPENPSLKAAVPSALSDIAVGDKLMVTGIFSDDKKTLPARGVYLMTKSDIAQRQVKESEKWATRGVSGRVASIDPVTRQIKIDVRGMVGSTSVVLTPKEAAKFLRYAPNSVKFSEAKESTLTEIQPGDMLRALGDRSADGASFAAEEIITGAFRTVAGKVKTVDVAKNEVVITDEASKKDITVDLGSATTLKKFPRNGRREWLRCSRDKVEDPEAQDLVELLVLRQTVLRQVVSPVRLVPAVPVAGRAVREAGSTTCSNVFRTSPRLT
jgi:hypothetical protein